MKAIGYCRSCNYEFEIDSTLVESYVEKSRDGATKYHAIINVDIRKDVLEKDAIDKCITNGTRLSIIKQRQFRLKMKRAADKNQRQI